MQNFKRFKRLIACVLAAATVGGTLCGCSGGGTNETAAVESTDGAVSDNSAAETSAAETSAAETERWQVTDGLGEYDFEGQTFSIVYSAKQVEMYPYFADEENGEVINDAVFTRSQKTSERFNVTLDYVDVGGQGAEVCQAVGKVAAAGDDSYDLALSHCFSGLTALISSGSIADWNDVPAVDFSQPWWNQTFHENLAVNGVNVCAISDLIYGQNTVILFNKNLTANYGVSDPYERVLDGSWTWDSLSADAKLASADLDGDGAFTEADQYGYSASLSHMVTPNIFSCGLTLAANGADGKPSVEIMNSQKMHDVVDIMYKLLFDGNQSWSGSEWQTELEPFGNGKVMYAQGNTLYLYTLRDVDGFEFGMVPMPKYDEAQEGYYDMAMTQLMLVPISATSLEMTGVISESLSADSYRYVVPALYETTYENKFLRDEKSYDMFMIIHGTGVYDFNWTYGNGNEFSYMMMNLMKAKSSDLSSYYEKYASKVQSGLDKVYEDVVANYN